MNFKLPAWISYCAIAVCVALSVVAQGMTQEPGTIATKPPVKAQSTLKAQVAEVVPVISIVEARERARILHDVYEATLRTIHSRYFKENGGVPIPSRAMEDVFAKVARRSQVTARWIAVNTQAMSLEHEAESDFEKEAVRTLSSGGQELEQVEDGMYRRAAPIALFDSCLKCHAPPPIRVTNARYAGLVIEMPVKAAAMD